MASTGFGGGNPPAVVEQKLRAEQILKNASGWFLWIAGLSIVNSVLTVSGTSFHFIFGLGVTQIVDGFGHVSGTTGSALGLVVNLFIAGVFVLFWNFARQGQRWAFLVGMALYAIDGLILLPFKDFLGVAFHAYALFRIYSGLQSVSILETLRQASLPVGAPIEPS
jgi:hypothetical protein